MYALSPAGSAGRTPRHSPKRGSEGDGAAGGGQPPRQRPRGPGLVIESPDTSSDEPVEPFGCGPTAPGRPAGPAAGPVSSARRVGPVASPASPGTPATAPAGTYDVVSVDAATLEGGGLLFRVLWVGGAVTWEPMSSFISGEGQVTCALTFTLVLSACFDATRARGHARRS